MQDTDILWKIQNMEIPDFYIEENYDIFPYIVSRSNIYEKKGNTEKGVPYDINRISSRNASKGELGPYKNSYLREIITSHKMGKASGVKSELVSTILSFHEKQ